MSANVAIAICSVLITIQIPQNGDTIFTAQRRLSRSVCRNRLGSYEHQAQSIRKPQTYVERVVEARLKTVSAWKAHPDWLTAIR